MERTKLKGKEYGALQTLFALLSAWQEALPILRDRLEAAGLDTDAQSLADLASDTLDGVLKTVPENKLAHIRQELAHVHIYVKTEAPGIRTINRPNYAYLPVGVLNDLLNHMIKAECVMCDKDAQDAKKCPYRQIIENALPHSVGEDHSTEHCYLSDMVLGLGVQE